MEPKDGREFTGKLNKYEYNLLDVVLALHEECTGASCDLSNEEIKNLYDTVKDRVNNWTETLLPSAVVFDAGVKFLCIIVLNEVEECFGFVK